MAYQLNILSLLFVIPLSALLLTFTIKWFKVKDTSYKTAITVAAILGVIGFIVDSLLSNLLGWAGLISGIINFIIFDVALAIFLLNKFYNTELKKTLLVWLVWFLLSLVLIVIVGVIISGVALVLGLSSASTTF
tara:strand:- start:154 stop:555 length:402 start_codon:yes stop_codon:yes gene_type:complete